MASKIGPDLESHPKIRHAWAMHHAALGLHLLALSFAQRTGGFVSAAFVAEKLPAKRERTAVIEALIAVAPSEKSAMWAAEEGGWRIHNFSKHIEFLSEEEQAQISRARSDAGRKGASTRWEGDGNLPSKGGCFANGKTDPSPSFANGKPDPLPSVCHNGHREVVVVKEDQPLRKDLLSLSEMLADGILLNDPKAKVRPRSERWLTAARLLVDQDERPIEEIERVIAWCQHDSFWRSNILSMPKLREKYGQLLLRMNSRPSNSAGDAASARRMEWLRMEGGIAG